MSLLTATLVLALLSQHSTPTTALQDTTEIPLQASLQASSNATVGFGAQEDEESLKGFFLGIITQADRTDNRKAIRSTWLKSFVKRGVDYRFFIGKDGLEREAQKRAEDEGDVVLLPFVDSYANLTRKTTLAANWTAEYMTLDYFVKVDDDVYLTVGGFTRIAQHLPERELYTGSIVYNGFIWPIGKWALPQRFRDMFPSGSYPDYAEGPTYILSADALTLLAASRNDGLLDEELFPFEDINSCLVLKRHGIHPTSMHDLGLKMHFMISDHGPGDHVSWGEDRNCSLDYIVYHSVNAAAMKKTGRAETLQGAAGVKETLCQPIGDS
uniref:Hexosyltransferase n=1 Tax=Lotharella oceanica TaxID=641309 RepID=A0A7S2TZQ6_9EUKA|mmetsp:Transcript_37406/g.68951  ORF Transcript_37406/g.68951 Transcript_37406/m.68951 type:complete len:326 (+) Transcript_37406:33-1010(+)